MTEPYLPIDWSMKSNPDRWNRRFAFYVAVVVVGCQQIYCRLNGIDEAMLNVSSLCSLYAFLLTTHQMPDWINFLSVDAFARRTPEFGGVQINLSWDRLRVSVNWNCLSLLLSIAVPHSFSRSAIWTGISQCNWKCVYLICHPVYAFIQCPQKEDPMTTGN